MKWHDTHALVTGGTRGIGLQLVKQLLDKGAQVTATGTTEQSLSEPRRFIARAWGATALLRWILRLSPALGERIMIGR
jgi:NAD(P)-dependent dehydrogenase (short-subunit alcohol dehydrogenase family)